MPRLITCGLAALSLLIGAGSAVATTLYRWVDAQGVVHYSDTPQPGAERINVQSAQTYRAPPVSKSAQTQGSSSGAQTRHAYQCSITTPTEQQSFYNPESVAISVSVTPELVSGDQLLVTVDGSPLPASGGTEFQISQPERGDHTIAVTVRALDGSTACTAAQVIFSVQRPSLLSPTSPAKGH
jgi:hypothetical protein